MMGFAASPEAPLKLQHGLLLPFQADNSMRFCACISGMTTEPSLEAPDF